MPDEFKDWYAATFGMEPADATLTHCKRELIHAIWELLLDEKFMEAYEHGIVIVFSDGAERLVFPRLFTYSADHPEK